MARDQNSGGTGGHLSPEEATEAVLAKARRAAPSAIDTVIAQMKKPSRGATASLTAAKIILEVSGVRAAATDEHRIALLEALKNNLSRSAYAEVLQAFAAMAGVDTAGAEEHPVDACDS